MCLSCDWACRVCPAAGPGMSRGVQRLARECRVRPAAGLGMWRVPLWLAGNCGVSRPVAGGKCGALPHGMSSRRRAGWTLMYDLKCKELLSKRRAITGSNSFVSSGSEELGAFDQSARRTLRSQCVQPAGYPRVLLPCGKSSEHVQTFAKCDWENGWRSGNPVGACLASRYHSLSEWRRAEVASPEVAGSRGSKTLQRLEPLPDIWRLGNPRQMRGAMLPHRSSHNNCGCPQQSHKRACAHARATS